VTAYIALAAIVFVGYLLRVPRFRDPLQPDYGAHMYMAQTWADGKRLYVDLPGGKPPGLYYLYMAVYRLCGGSPATLRAFVAFCYSLATVAVYFLALAVWHNPAVALAGAATFALLTAVPLFNAMSSQAENFMLLFETAALALYLLSTHGSATFVAGMALGTAFLFKPTVLPQLGLLGIWTLLVRHSLSGTLLLAAGFAVVILAPFIHFMRMGKTSGWAYFRETIDFMRLTSKSGRMFLSRLPGYKERTEARRNRKQVPVFGRYVWSRIQSPLANDVALIRARLGRLTNSTVWFWILVCAAAAFQRSSAGALVAVTCAVAVAVATLQRSYFPGHYLPVTPTASVLAGWLVWTAAADISVGRGGVGSLFLLVLAGLAGLRMAVSWYMLSFAYSPEETLVLSNGPWAERWIAARDVAELFRKEVPAHDYVLQFGDNPQVYYQSGRRSAAAQLTWVYPTPQPLWEDFFVRAVNERRPAMIAVFERLLDMNTMQSRLEPVYKQKTVVRDQFPVYQRIDEPIDRLRSRDVYLFGTSNDDKPVLFDGQQSPTAPFVSLIVICDKPPGSEIRDLARSLGEPVEIICIGAGDIGTESERLEKVISFPDTRQKPVLANRGIKIARGDRLLFIDATSTMPAKDTCRAVLAAINSDIRVGLSAPAIAPATVPMAVRANALFRVGHLDTSFETLAGTFTELAYRTVWGDYRCVETLSPAPEDTAALTEHDEHLFLEKAHISIQHFASSIR